jgi:hypothetical protein
LTAVSWIIAKAALESNHTGQPGIGALWPAEHRRH